MRQSGSSGTDAGHRARLISWRKGRAAAAVAAVIAALAGTSLAGAPAAAASPGVTVIVTATGLLSPVAAVLEVGGTILTQYHLIDAVDGTAPGPGPALGPALESPDGALEDYTGDRYTVAGPGVRLAAPVVQQRDGFTLYRTPTKWHLLDEHQNVFADGWATSPIGYTYFPRRGPGTLEIDLSRTAFTGAGPPGRATIRVGTVKLDDEGTPVFGRVLAVRHASVPNGERTTVAVHVPATPVTVQVDMSTFQAPPDTRALAAQPAFRFVPDAARSG